MDITVTVNITGPYTNYAEITAMDQVDPDSDPSSDRTVDDLSDGLPDDDEDNVTVTPTQNNPNLGKTVSGTNQTLTSMESPIRRYHPGETEYLANHWAPFVTIEYR